MLTVKQFRVAHIHNMMATTPLPKTADRKFAVICKSSMLTPQSVHISDRIAEVTLPSDRQFVQLKDRKNALHLVTNSHLGLVHNDISKLVLNGSQHTNGSSSSLTTTTTTTTTTTNNNTRHLQHERYSRDQIKILKQEIDKILKTDANYIREPAPNLNMFNPQTWYPRTRELKRRIIYHYGPTNSGKTYHALEALKKAKNGVYCAPLRLLAWEVYENLGECGIQSRLMTGEEMFGEESATHTSCTVEMCDVFEAEYDVAVIDEIQLMGHCGGDRGWAWTRALLGVHAKEVHICGDETVKALVTSIAEKCGDTMEYRKYKRLCPLRMDTVLTSYRDIERGDCIVGFNRTDLYQIKQEIERNTSFKCALIYGRLPPENRRTQARLFNKRGTGYDVLVSSDAIGMGLNLNIRRVIFHSITKWNGYSRVNLSTSEILQIAGRAGRYKLYDEGYVSCMNGKDYQFVYRNLQQRPPKQLQACLRPEESYMYDIAQQFPWLRFSDIIKCFKERCKINNDEYFIPNYAKLVDIAQILENIPLSVKDKYIFTTIPLRANSIECLGFVQEWAINLAKDKLVHLHIDEQQLIAVMERVQHNLRVGYNVLNSRESMALNGTAMDINMNMSDINDVELLYAILSCYRFLAFRFPTFVDYQKCQHLLSLCANMIQQGFDDMTIQNKYHFQQQSTLQKN